MLTAHLCVKALEMARTHVDKAGTVSALQVVENRSLVQVGHVGHIVDLLVFGRVHLLDVILLHRPRLKTETKGLM